ncbi:unnamed protein product [Citrullus colocynthis]|uniref:CAF1B/HIR1 beta-propeller domain-containing protein n=1 Tax=Citrullus colocynthis TaxID=252529 RepID=A0ABP0YIN2_9ROSI
MKGGTLQINWHDSKPVLTLDFHPLSGLLATGGADFDIKLWLLNSGDELKKVPGATYQSSLSYHGSAVNSLRFSPSGEQLASGADGGELIIWKLHHLESGQSWKVLKTLSFHRKDVLDLQWSHDGAYLISGSVDNSCIIWDVSKGSVHQILDAHLHYVQGVALDPLGKYAASLSSDRSCRIYAYKTPTKAKNSEKMTYVCQHVITKAENIAVDDSKSARNHLFHDETLPSFFRRLAWSPDGSFLLVPAGICKILPASEPVNTAYIFSRKDFSRPAIQLPGASKPVVAVCFCPKLFRLRGLNSAGYFKLPHRVIFAVVTLNSLYIYDTESVVPLAIMAGLHYAAITDVAWSADAHYLALSSQDGYCTLVEFENDELGSPLALSEDRTCTTTTKQNTSLTDVTINDDQNRKTEAEGKHEENKSVEKPENMVIEKASSGDNLVESDCRGHETEKKASKQVSISSSSNSVTSKPAKRRITPMAIDP